MLLKKALVFISICFIIVSVLWWGMMIIGGVLHM